MQVTTKAYAVCKIKAFFRVVCIVKQVMCGEFASAISRQLTSKVRLFEHSSIPDLNFGRSGAPLTAIFIRKTRIKPPVICTAWKVEITTAKTA
jgi:hypothetical protein